MEKKAVRITTTFSHRWPPDSRCDMNSNCLPSLPSYIDHKKAFNSAPRHQRFGSSSSSSVSSPSIYSSPRLCSPAHQRFMRWPFIKIFYIVSCFTSFSYSRSSFSVSSFCFTSYDSSCCSSSSFLSFAFSSILKILVSLPWYNGHTMAMLGQLPHPTSQRHTSQLENREVLPLQANDINIPPFWLPTHATLVSSVNNLQLTQLNNNPYWAQACISPLCSTPTVALHSPNT